MPLRNRKSLYTAGTARIGQDVHTVREETDRKGNTLFNSMEESNTVCASCNKVIHENKELGGYCFRCERAVCGSCTDLRCDVHHKVLCQEDAYQYEGAVVCRCDSVFQLIGAILWPNKPTRPGLTGCGINSGKD